MRGSPSTLRYAKLEFRKIVYKRENREKYVNCMGGWSTCWYSCTTCL